MLGNKRATITLSILLCFITFSIFINSMNLISYNSRLMNYTESDFSKKIEINETCNLIKYIIDRNSKNDINYIKEKLIQEIKSGKFNVGEFELIFDCELLLDEVKDSAYRLYLKLNDKIEMYTVILNIKMDYYELYPLHY